MRHSVFYPASIGFIVGIFLSSVSGFMSLFLSSVSFNIFLCCIFTCLVFHALYSGSAYIHREPKTYSSLFLIFVFCLCVALGMLRTYFFISNTGSPELRKLVNQTISTTGIITEEPDERDMNVRLTIALEKYSTKIITSAPLHQNFSYGDEVEITGKLVEPENFLGDTGREFDYEDYLKKDGILYELNSPKIQVIKQQQGNFLKEKLLDLKNIFIEKLDETIPFPESRLGAGLIVAGKKALPKNIQQDFQNSGTLQVVVLSGYNVTIIAEAIAVLFSFLPLFISSSLSIVSIVCFTIMAGGSATIIRGSVMAVIVIFGKLLRRNYNVLRALIVTGIGMLVMNPMLLVFDPSFQLSFLATLGLIILSPFIQKKLFWLPEKFKIKEVLSATLAAQIFVTPLLLWTTGTLSLISVPANFLLSLCIPATMLLCFTTGIMGMFFPFLDFIFAWPAYVLLRLELFFVHLFASLPFASIGFSDFPTWCVALLYMSYAVILWYLSQRETKNS